MGSNGRGCSWCSIMPAELLARVLLAINRPFALRSVGLRLPVLPLRFMGGSLFRGILSAGVRGGGEGVYEYDTGNALDEVPVMCIVGDSDRMPWRSRSNPEGPGSMLPLVVAAEVVSLNFSSSRFFKHAAFGFRLRSAERGRGTVGISLQ